MSAPRVVAIILTGNRPYDVMECLESFERNTYPEKSAIVLDYFSMGGSLEAIKFKHPNTEIKKLSGNLGYAGNNNLGIRMALARGAEWILVLNDDTTLDSGCIAELMEVAACDENVGIIGPLIYHYTSPNIIQSAGGLLSDRWRSLHIAQNEPDLGQIQGCRRVDWISGCAILVRRKMVEQTGLLDERFFIYWEDVDWCLRAQRLGWKIMHAPRAMVWHKGVQVDYRPQPSVTYYMTRNHLLLCAKHRAPLSVWMFVFLEALLPAFKAILNPGQSNFRAHSKARLYGVADFLCRRWGPTPFV